MQPFTARSILEMLLGKTVLGNERVVPRLFLIHHSTQASSKTLTNGPRATEERIADGALTGQQFTPGPPRIIPENYKRARINAEQDGEVRITTEKDGAPLNCIFQLIHVISIIFWDSFHHSMILSLLKVFTFESHLLYITQLYNLVDLYS